MLESEPNKLLNESQVNYNLENFLDLNFDIFEVCNRDLLYVV